jgi:pimeloyl-ACP methyl ester carboxylesterase
MLNTPTTTATGKVAAVNGINLYYEIHGRGFPLVLLHGGLGTISMFGEVLPALAQSRQVIAVELRGHGHTDLGSAPLSFEGMADDVFALLDHLHIQKADLFGYSLGGGAALQTAIRHPQAVRKLVLVSAPCKRSGWYPGVLAGMAQMSAEAARSWVGSPMQQDYASAAPHPEDWPLLADRLGSLLRQEYNWSRDVAAMKAPVLIIVGDADAVRTAHAVEFFELLGGGKAEANWDGSGMSASRLAILPATSHYTIFSSPALVPLAAPFLDAPLPPA